MFNTSVLADSQIESIALADLERSDLARANMAPHPMCEEEPFHFSAEYRDVALRHVWTRAQAAIAAEVRERGIPRWI